jgi:hypothetical protein
VFVTSRQRLPPTTHTPGAPCRGEQIRTVVQHVSGSQIGKHPCLARVRLASNISAEDFCCFCLPSIRQARLVLKGTPTFDPVMDCVSVLVRVSQLFSACTLIWLASSPRVLDTECIRAVHKKGSSRQTRGAENSISSPSRHLPA